MMREHLGNLGIDGRISKCILKKQNEMVWTGFSRLRIWSRTEPKDYST
jgi:hypothetical protein